MNGLLHRVAARAAGTAVTLRSDAGLLYAGGGASGWGDVSEFVDAGEPQARTPTGAAPVAQTASTSVTRERERPATRAADLAELPAVASAARTPPPLVDMRTDAAADRAAPTTVPGAESALRPDFDEPRSVMPPSAESPPVPRTARPAIEPRYETAPAPREIATTTRTALHAGEPAPLMPREARQPPLAPVPQPANRRGASLRAGAAAQSEADTEVHIHIGRIDVTALHEAPAPRRRAAAAPAPMSLDGYLAQRGRA